MSKNGSAVYQLRLSEKGFAITARAIQELSLRNGKYETLPGVVAHTINSIREIDTLIVRELDGQITSDGDIKVHLRLDNKTRDLFKEYQASLSAIVEHPVTVRDCVVLMSLLVLNEV